MVKTNPIPGGESSRIALYTVALTSFTLSHTPAGRVVTPSALTTVKTGLLMRWLSTSLAPVRSQSSRPIVYLPVPAKPISNTIVFSNELFSIGFYIDLHSGALRYSGSICSFSVYQQVEFL